MKIRTASVVVLVLFAAASPARADRTVRGIHSTWTAVDSVDAARVESSRHDALLKTYPFPAGYGTARTAEAARPRPAPSESFFSWRDVNGADWLTPIRDQGSCGSCFVFGSVSVMESLFKITLGDPTYNPDLSEQKVISCTNLGSCATGGTAEGVGAHLKSLGTPDEACYPYTSGSTGNDGDCNGTCADWQTRASKISDWKMSVLPPTVDQLKTQIKDGSTTSPVAGPVIANLQVYSDFYGYKTGVYSRSQSATAQGWHIVTLLGWDDSDDSWIVKNSWGTDWGQDGYGKLSRAADCSGLFTTGLCFASHTTYFSVASTEAPSAPCVDPRQTNVTVPIAEPAHAVSLTLKNCGTKGPFDWNGKVSTSKATVAPASGTLTAQHTAQVEISFEPAKLGLGTHVISATFSSGTSEAVAKIEVEVVNAPAPDAGPADAGASDDTSDTSNMSDVSVGPEMPDASDLPDTYVDAAVPAHDVGPVTDDRGSTGEDAGTEPTDAASQLEDGAPIAKDQGHHTTDAAATDASATTDPDAAAGTSADAAGCSCTLISLPK